MGGTAEGARPWRPTRLTHVDFAVLSLYWVAIGYLWQSLGTLLLPDLVQELVGATAKGRALSLLEGIGTIVAIVWQPLAGALSDRTRSRWGRRHPYILTGTLGDLVFLAALALSGGYWPLVLFYTLLQLASNTAQGPYQGLLPDVVRADQRGTASGYYGVANLLGILLGSVVAGAILATAGRGAAFLSIGVTLAATMLCTVLVVPDRSPPVRRQFRSGGEAVLTTFASPFRHPNFAWLLGSRLLILMGIVGIQSFVYFYFSDVFFEGNASRTAAASSVLLGLVVALALLVTWPAARLSDRVGRRNLVTAGGALSAAGILILLFSGYEWLPRPLLEAVGGVLHVPPLAAQALLVGLLLGPGIGVFLSVDWAFLADVVPPEEAGLYFGFANIATAGSGVIARFVAGFLLDAFNAGPRVLHLPGGYPVIFFVFFLWVVAGTLMVRRVRVPPRPVTHASG
jgi:MFS family permease